ncbi:hypothetical protein DWH01_30055 [Escherichia coli]|nr:hypothetical protein [Escherichia coli]EFO1672132.1 hypothetical protein [Escherichia coli]
MNISNSQVNRLRHFVRAGLRSLFRPEPQTAVEWADANYYLPKESAYQEGRWETLPFQRAIMNAMGSDYIREVNVVKSARVGYSKMLLGVYAYFIEHKQRNTLIWLPTDGDAENFMKTHVEPTIRDIPLLLALAPWYGKKHRDNTLTMKRFSNGRGFWCLGGKAAKNYREKSVDVAGYDELAAFDEDIEQEGSPTFLGDKRIEGSVWPKSIRGSTPKVRGTCQIERAASESPHFMRFHVACPHCGEEQYLKFGDKETSFGLKWTPDDPSSVFYLCEHNACVIRQQELDFTDARYICEKTGIWTRDGILWFSSSGEEIEPPDSVTFHIWTAYSPFTTWVQIVKDWMKTKGDTSGGSPPVFSLTSDGKLTAKNADISGSVNANSGTLNNVTINENCQIKGKLSANQIEGDIVKTVSKSFPRTNSYASGTITVRISDDQKFDRQVMIPPVLFRGGKHENFNSNNQQSYWYSTCRLRVTLNGQEIFNQSTTDAQGVFSSVIDMPAGQGTLTLTFTVSSSGANNWTPTTSISDLLVVVMKKSTAGISIS